MRDTKSWVTVSKKTRGDEILIYIRYQYATRVSSLHRELFLNQLLFDKKVMIKLSYLLINSSQERFYSL